MKINSFRFPYWLLSLAVPVVLILAGMITENIFLKMSVPVLCALIILTQSLDQKRVRIHLWLAAALGFSAAGDFFMAAKGSRTSWFVVGILLFLMAHAGYFMYSLSFWREGRFSGKRFLIIFLLLLVPYSLYFALKLQGAIGEPALASAAFSYLILSCVAFAAAAARREKLIPFLMCQTAIALILFSDTIISLTEFCGYDGLNFLMLPTYYAAHLLVAGYVAVRSVCERRNDE